MLSNCGRSRQWNEKKCCERSVLWMKRIKKLSVKEGQQRSHHETIFDIYLTSKNRRGLQSKPNINRNLLQEQEWKYVNWLIWSHNLLTDLQAISNRCVRERAHMLYAYASLPPSPPDFARSLFFSLRETVLSLNCKRPPLAYQILN